MRHLYRCTPDAGDRRRQVSRVDAVRMAVMSRTRECRPRRIGGGIGRVLPVRDGLDAVANAGATAVASPADQYAIKRSSPPPTSTDWRWCSPDGDTSGTERRRTMNASREGFMVKWLACYRHSDRILRPHGLCVLRVLILQVCEFCEFRVDRRVMRMRTLRVRAVDRCAQLVRS